MKTARLIILLFSFQLSNTCGPRCTRNNPHEDAQRHLQVTMCHNGCSCLDSTKEEPLLYCFRAETSGVISRGMAKYFDEGETLFGIMLEASILTSIPSRLFARNPIKSFTLLNTLLLALSPDGRIFRGSENTLEKINITGNSYVQSWNISAFSTLSAIKEIIITFSDLRSILIEQWSNLPTSLKVLDLSHNKIELIDENVFINSQVASLFLNNNNLKEISKNIFPDKLRTLDVSHNKLKSLPPGFLSSLPKLEELNLANNKFIILDFRIFQNHIEKKSLVVNLEGNVLDCCRLTWYAEFHGHSRRTLLKGTCENPEVLKGKQLKELTKEILARICRRGRTHGIHIPEFDSLILHDSRKDLHHKADSLTLLEDFINTMIKKRKEVCEELKKNE